MVVDIHTHTFPEKIAERAMSKLSHSSDIIPQTNGTIEGLIESMHRQGIDYSVIVPIVTNPAQLDTINRTAIETNEKYADMGVISFGSIHPDNQDYDAVMRSLVSNGIKGLKLHPVFQNVAFDDIRYMRIIDSACSHNLPIIVHGGQDVSFPGVELVTPKEIRNVVEQVHPVNMIMAHMGAWGYWDEMIELLNEHKVMMDTSFSFMVPKMNVEKPDFPQLSMDKFVTMVRLAGAENVFFGSDSPWNPQDESARPIRESELTDEECRLILGGNAQRILGLG